MNASLPRHLFSWFLLLVFLFIFLSAWQLADIWNWPRNARFFPFGVGIVGVLLALAELSTLYVPAMEKRLGVGRVLDLVFESDLSEREVWRRAAQALGTLVLLAVGCVVIGFHAAIALFLVGYLRLKARAPWLTTAILTTGLWVALFVVLDRIMIIPWLDPLVLRWYRQLF